MPAVATAAGLPSRLGKYELLLPLAAGGMARIYIGRSTGIGQFERHVVLKMITPERANDLTAVNMFLDEARLAASLNHQNVAQVFEVGADAGIHYLAMEYVHGQDLRAVLAKAGGQGTRIPLELALTVVAGAAAGLNHAHERRGPDGMPLGIVHRDVSPSNIMIGYDGAVKLLDFGIAKATQRSVETQSGIIKGKFAYMAPEQCRGRDVDRRSDVFSLGIILYEVSTQHRCFRADSDFDTMHRIVTGDVVRPTRLVQGYPPALEAIVMKALATDAAQRYQSAGLLLEALESFAVTSRMSLSTMSLGRFMRDMFGEQQEPWLNTAATKLLQPLAAKENTISSTDGRGSPAHPRVEQTTNPVDTSGLVEEDGRFDNSAGLEAAKTMLMHDAPPGRSHEQTDPPQNEWNAKTYPLPDSAMATTMPDSGGPAYARQSDRHLDHGAAMGQQPMPQPLGQYPGHRPTPQPGTMNMPHGTQPLPNDLPPQGQFQHTPSSGTGPALPIGIVSTKHGYASGVGATRGDVSYPRYEPNFEPVGSAELQIKPNRRPLFIGLGIVAVGVIVILAVTLGGDNEPQSIANADDDDSADGSGSAVVDNQQVTPAVGSGSGDDVIDENMVSILIHSDPAGADVMIAGAKIGVTPFDKKLKRGTKIQQLTIRLAGYVDFTTKIDLSGEYENTNIKLVRTEDAGSASDDKSGTTEESGTTDKAGTNDKTGTSGTDTSDTTGATGAPSTTGTSTKTGTTTGTKTGTGTTSTTTGPKTGTGTTSTTTGTKTGTGTTSTTTGTKTGTGTTSTTTGTKTGTGTTTSTGTKTGTGTTTSTGTKTGTGTGSSTKTGTGTKTGTKPKCQPPGPNVDPFGLPVCKT